VNARTVMPPSRDGVGASRVALPAGAWPTLLDFLVQQFPMVTRAEWQARMQQGEVLDESGQALPPATPYRAHARIFYYRSLPHEAPIPFDEVVLYRDDYLVAVDKPHFLPVTPAGRYLQQTLLVRLKRSLGIETLTPMHRIDRETAGLVLFTIQPQTRNLYQSLFRQRSVQKYYEAIAPWRADLALPQTRCSRLVESASFMKMMEIDGEANAETRIECIEVRGQFARYGLHPVSGQKHQLRAHMAALDIPIVNDRIYPHLYPDAGDEQDYRQPLKLLAKSIRFTDPVSGAERFFESRQQLDFE
jgi:tRNA pseudouridine32 synthase/23S rRNA pseudouridine746 synthase